MITIKNISVVKNENQIIDNFSFRFGDVGLYTLPGKNGSGKTTLLNVLAGLSKYTGEIYYKNSIIDGEYLRENSFYMSQFDLLFEDKNALENVSEFLKIENTTYSIDDFITLSKEVKLDSVINNKVNTYSGGQKRKLSLLIALLSNKKMIILDEPFYGIEEKARDFLLTCIEEKSNLHLIIMTNHEDVSIKKSKLMNEVISDDNIHVDSVNVLKYRKKYPKNIFLCKKTFRNNILTLTIFSVIFTSIIALLSFFLTINNVTIKKPLSFALDNMDYYMTSIMPDNYDVDDSHAYKKIVNLNIDLDLYPSIFNSILISKSNSSFDLLLGVHPNDNNFTDNGVLITEHKANEISSMNNIELGKCLDLELTDDLGNSYKIVGIIKNPINSKLYEKLDEYSISSYHNSIDHLYTSLSISNRLHLEQTYIETGLIFFQNYDKKIVSSLLNKKFFDFTFKNIVIGDFQFFAPLDISGALIIFGFSIIFILIFLIVYYRKNIRLFMRYRLFNYKKIQFYICNTLPIILATIILSPVAYFVTRLFISDIDKKIMENFAISNMTIMSFSFSNLILVFVVYCLVFLIITFAINVYSLKNSRDDLLKELSK